MAAGCLQADLGSPATQALSDVTKRSGRVTHNIVTDALGFYDHPQGIEFWRRSHLIALRDYQWGGSFLYLGSIYVRLVNLIATYDKFFSCVIEL